MSKDAEAPAYSNALAQQTSPYLLQHAHNPVNWYPWDEEALRQARHHDKPILLSIGYSACHWCHVMAHESFEDPDTARLMNDLYINIKVDREERPDLDRIYQTAYQILMQRGGGWPLTMILSPEDHTPFFAGTYFPPEERHGMPSFCDVLQKVSDFYQQRRDEIDTQNQRFKEVLKQIETAVETAAAPLDSHVLDQARSDLGQSYDDQNGGFGAAPKFPHPSNLERLLRHYLATRAHQHSDQMALDMCSYSLARMAKGGLYDQLGGGFFRYSVDAQWCIPHFEKMLYDNAALIYLYSIAYQLDPQPLFMNAALESADWVYREMQSSEGGYYSALDADSDGIEGQYYVWSRQQISDLLEAESFNLLSLHYGLHQPPNFEGRYHLNIDKSGAELAQQTSLSEAQCQQGITQARQVLLHARAERKRPHLDDKILCSWNALMIKAMAAVGRYFNRLDFIASAEMALDFIRQHLWREQRLLATYNQGQARLMGYLDDYAFLIDAVLELVQARWRDGDLRFAQQLADSLLLNFEDRDHGGFYFTAHDHESLIQRPKPLSDESIPSGNAVAASALLRLGYLLGEQTYIDAAERVLKYAAGAIKQSALSHCSLLHVFEAQHFGMHTVVLRGADEVLHDWHSLAQRGYRPLHTIIAIPNQASDLPGRLASITPSDSGFAQICEQHMCREPIRDRSDWQAYLQST